MGNRGAGWKRGRWGGKWGGRQGGGVTASWRTNYRGWLSRGGNAGWGASLGRMGGRIGGADWGGRRLRSSMDGSMGPGLGLSSALSDQGSVGGQTGSGGILSNFRPGFGGGKVHLRDGISGAAALGDDVRERAEAAVTVLIMRYAQVFYNATGDDLGPVRDNLVDLLGPKYSRLILDWIHQQGHVPASDETERFVVWVVEAAAVDGGQEPLLWKVQRAISRLLDRLFGDRDEQEEIQSQGQVGTIPTSA